VYVSTAWLNADMWGFLMAVKKRAGYASDAEVVRSAIYVAAVEDAQGRPLVSMDEALRAFRWAAEEVERARRAFRAQLGRLREVAVRLPASAPIARLKKRLKEQLRRSSDVPIGIVVAYSLATYLHVLERRPTGLPEPVRGMLRLVYERAAAAPRSERRRIALSEMGLRAEAARRLAKELGAPVDAWWRAVEEEVARADDPLPVLRRYIEGEAPPKLPSSPLFGELMAKLLADAKTDEEFRRLWWLRREALRRAAASKYERELVDHISRLVDSDPEAARRLAEMAAAGRRVEVPAPEPAPPELAAAEVEEKLSVFDKVALDALRDPDGAERGIYKRAEFFDAFYKWARSVKADLPESLGTKLRDAASAAYYCRPGGPMRAAEDVLERRAPLPPNEHPGVHALRRYAKTWLRWG
jgi:catechol 2,3-dioxygenase-like lactoylglutathione lyase family enzyme